MPRSEGAPRRALPALALALALSGSAAAAPAVSAITGSDQDYRPLIEATRQASFVLLGENTHGTHEYYRERARISEQLIREAGFQAVAIEGDWSGAARVNRYVRGLGDDRSAEEALSDFDEFPTWMWRNADFRDFVERLRQLNLQRPAADRIGVYALDVYDFFDAADAVVAHLRTLDRAKADRVRGHYRCFASLGRSAENYTLALRQGANCSKRAEAALAEVRALPRPPDPEAAEAWFAVQRAAATVVGGEEYFRVMEKSGYSWNARDRRMAEAAGQVSEHLSRAGRRGRVVIWAHNTHVGDARETSQRQAGELSLGQLLREQGGAFLVGFLTYQGEVTAAATWGARPRTFTVRAALPESHEAELRAQGPANALRILDPGQSTRRRQHRAIGVVYSPANELQAHYLESVLERQFDAVVFLERTTALTPLPRGSGRQR